MTTGNGPNGVTGVSFFIVAVVILHMKTGLVGSVDVGQHLSPLPSALAFLSSSVLVIDLVIESAAFRFTMRNSSSHLVFDENVASW